MVVFAERLHYFFPHGLLELRRRLPRRLLAERAARVRHGGRDVNPV
jgi:hypothetical protein